MNEIAQTIITAGAVVGAILALWGAIYGFSKWVARQNRQTDDIADLEARHKADVAALKADEETRVERIEAELSVLTKAMLAVLDGLKQQGCNGEVTAAHHALREHLNHQAHSTK